MNLLVSFRELFTFKVGVFHSFVKSQRHNTPFLHLVLSPCGKVSIQRRTFQAQILAIAQGARKPFGSFPSPVFQCYTMQTDSNLHFLAMQKSIPFHPLDKIFNFPKNPPSTLKDREIYPRSYSFKVSQIFVLNHLTVFLQSTGPPSPHFPKKQLNACQSSLIHQKYSHNSKMLKYNIILNSFEITEFISQFQN